jgi:hypothetical protein
MFTNKKTTTLAILTWQTLMGFVALNFEKGIITRHQTLKSI